MQAVWGPLSVEELISTELWDMTKHVVLEPVWAEARETWIIGAGFYAATTSDLTRKVNQAGCPFSDVLALKDYREKLVTVLNYLGGHSLSESLAATIAYDAHRTLSRRCVLRDEFS